ncbi:hypothetical protein B0H19DRAFT_1237531 [Mycena capillaripes]|nr:hypothetical protein B0H19DRAFT_1237531 [Mycena capillaripes]
MTDRGIWQPSASDFGDVSRSFLGASRRRAQQSLTASGRVGKLTSDALAATKLALNAIQASTDAFPPTPICCIGGYCDLGADRSELLTPRPKSNKKGCERIAHRSAQLVQDIWRQTKDFNVTLPAEVERSVAEMETLFKEIDKFFNGLKYEKPWQRFARQDRNKVQVEEYGRLLDEAMLHFSINLELSIHRLHVESAAADQKRHTAILVSNRKRHAADRTRHSAVLAVSQMSEFERLIPDPVRHEKKN